MPLVLILSASLCGLTLLAVLLGLLRLDAHMVGFTPMDLAVLAAGGLLFVTWYLT